MRLLFNYKNSTNMFFSWAMIVGVMVSLSSNNWLTIWMGIEISMMSILPLKVESGILNPESMMKYFIIQMISSLILIMGILLMISTGKYLNFIYLSLMIKMGVAPFHNWIISMIEGLSYPSMFLILTLMKIPPMIMISCLSMKINIIILITILVGSIMGINENSIRKLIAYSSIFNMGFMISCYENNLMWIQFLLMYSVMILMLTIVIFKNNINYINQLMMNYSNSTNKMITWLMMLSLGGMPPMMGLINKLMVIEFMIQNNELLMMTFMIMLSLVVMFYYMRMTYLCVLLSSLTMKWNMNLSFTSSFSFTIITILISPSILTLKSLL